MARLYIEQTRESDQRRAVLLAECMENEHSKALLQTVRLAIDEIDKTLVRDAYTMTDEQMRYKLAQIAALRGVLEIPDSAMDFIMRSADLKT